MRSPRMVRSAVDVVAEDIALLSSALARVEHLPGTDKITIARKIGHAVGLDLATRKSRVERTDIQTSIARLFRRLSLGDVTLQEWDPVVFVRHSAPFRKKRVDSLVGNLQAALGEGVLEGLVLGRRRGRLFVRHSIPVGPQYGMSSRGGRKK